MPDKKRNALGAWFAVSGGLCPLLGVCLAAGRAVVGTRRTVLLAAAILLAGWAAGRLCGILGGEGCLEGLAGRLGRPLAVLAYGAGYLACLFGAAVFLRLGAEVWRAFFWPTVPAALLLIPLLLLAVPAGGPTPRGRARLGATAGVAAVLLPLFWTLRTGIERGAGQDLALDSVLRRSGSFAWSSNLPKGGLEEMAFPNWKGMFCAALLLVSLLLSASSFLWYMNRASGRLIAEVCRWRSTLGNGWFFAEIQETGRVWEYFSPILSVVLVYFASAGFLDGEAALDYCWALHFSLFLPLFLLLLLLLRRSAGKGRP